MVMKQWLHTWPGLLCGFLPLLPTACSALLSFHSNHKALFCIGCGSASNARPALHALSDTTLRQWQCDSVKEFLRIVNDQSF